MYDFVQNSRDCICNIHMLNCTALLSIKMDSAGQCGMNWTDLSSSRQHPSKNYYILLDHFTTCQ
jgi:hypothetical protein